MVCDQQSKFYQIDDIWLKSIENITTQPVSIRGGGGVQVVCDHQSKFYQILDNIWLESPETEIVDIA